MTNDDQPHARSRLLAALEQTIANEDRWSRVSDEDLDRLIAAVTGRGAYDAVQRPIDTRHVALMPDGSLELGGFRALVVADAVTYTDDGTAALCAGLKAQAEATGQFVPGSVTVRPAWKPEMTAWCTVLRSDPTVSGRVGQLIARDDRGPGGVWWTVRVSRGEHGTTTHVIAELDIGAPPETLR